MKIRADFVTNSSSSSYLLVFDDEPMDTKDLLKKMFGERTEVYGWDDDHYKLDEINLSDFLKSIMDSKPLTEEEVFEEFNGGYIPGSPDWPSGIFDLEGEEKNKALEEYHAKCDAFYKRHADWFLNEHKGKLIYRIHVGDGGGCGEFSGGVYGVLDCEGSEIFECQNFKLSNH